MKQLLVSVAALWFSLAVFGQGAIREGNRLTAEQQRIQKVEEEIRTLEKEFNKAKDLYEQTYYSENLQPFFPNFNGSKEYLTKKKNEIERTLDLIQETQTLSMESQLNRLKTSINMSTNNTFQERVDILNSNLNKIRGLLKEKKTKSDSEILEQELREAEMKREDEKMDKELVELDKMLAEAEKNSNKKKSLSLDEFLDKKGINSSTPKKSGGNLDDLLGVSNKKKTNTNGNNLDQLLAGGNTKSGKTKDLDKLISTEDTKDEEYEIKTVDGKMGVVDKNGNLLIPFKEWQIYEYKLGIARVKVKIKGKSFKGECGLVIAYKCGFVGSDGNFIDDYTIEPFYIDPFAGPDLSLFRYSEDDRSTEEERKKREEQVKQRRNKERAIRSKRCELEADRWVQSLK